MDGPVNEEFRPHLNSQIPLGIPQKGCFDHKFSQEYGDNDSSQEYDGDDNRQQMNLGGGLGNQHGRNSFPLEIHDDDDDEFSQMYVGDGESPQIYGDVDGLYKDGEEEFYQEYDGYDYPHQMIHAEDRVTSTEALISPKILVITPII